MYKKQGSQDSNSLKYKSDLAQIVTKFPLNLDQFFSQNLPILEPAALKSVTTLKEVAILVRRVNRTRTSGKQSRYSVMAAIGNEENVFGIGVAKNKEKQAAKTKAINNAIKRAIYIKTDGFREYSEKKVGSSVVSILPLVLGAGIKSGPRLKELAILAGIKNCRIKIRGSNNPLNCFKAFYECLKDYECKR